MSIKLGQLSKVIDSEVKEPIQKLIDALKHALIDPLEEIKEDAIAWEQVNEETNERFIMGTLGNFSAIIGKAKGRKSFFVNLVISIALAKDRILSRFKGCLPPEQSEVLYFDTEQGKAHVQKAVRRICRRIGVDAPKNLKTYYLRKYSPSERLELIEYAIYNTPNVGLVVIDGIKDLITSINDEEQANMVVSKLLKWTEERNIHIITVLHQNKSDNNARGHVGTELVNKAETVLSVTRSETDSEVSIVEPLQCRNKEPEPFAFEIIDGLPELVENFQMRTETKKNRYDIDEMEDFKKYQILNDVYLKESEFGYSELVRQVKASFKSLHKMKIGDNRIKDFITICKNNNWITQEGSKKPYKLGEFQTDNEDTF